MSVQEGKSLDIFATVPHRSPLPTKQEALTPRPSEWLITVVKNKRLRRFHPSSPSRGLHPPEGLHLAQITAVTNVMSLAKSCMTAQPLHQKQEPSNLASPLQTLSLFQGCFTLVSHFAHTTCTRTTNLMDNSTGP